MINAAVLSTLASPRRQEILRLTWHEERTAGDLARAMPDVTFGAVSQQLKQLVDAGALLRRADGRTRWYHANRAALAPLRRTLEHMWDDKLWDLKILAELEAGRRGPRPRTRKTITRKKTT